MKRLWGVTSINVIDKGISSLKGVEYFTALEILECSWNSLTELDVSKNTVLTTLYCKNNQLTEFDVGNNTALTILNCRDNQLTTLDVSKNTALETLWCENNRLKELDVSNNTALGSLSCYNNQLTELDVSKNTDLKSLSCYEQKVSGFSIIATGDASYPYKQIFSRDISADKIANIERVTAKDSNGAEITTEYSDGIAQFAALPATVTYYYATGYSDKVMDVTISGLSAVIEISAVFFPDENFRAYISGNLDTDNDGCLSASEITAATNINVSGQGISSLKVIEYFTALTTLDCSSNQLTALDLSKNTALTSLNCGGNQLTTLDIRNCPSLPPSSVNADSTVQITHGAQDGFPSFGKHSLILSGQLGLDFLLTVPEATNTTGSYVTFTVNGREGIPAMFSNVASKDILSNDTYRFTCYINSVQMADKIQALYV